MGNCTDCEQERMRRGRGAMSTELSPTGPLFAPDRRRRPFRITDGMILVGFTALGLAGSRFVYPWGTPWRFAFIPWHVRGTIAPALISLTAAIVIIRLIPPRPSRPQLFREPGFAAAFITLVLIGSKSVCDSVDWLIDDNIIQFPRHVREWCSIEVWISGLIVMAVWLALALAGSWRAEASWIDRAGRVLGILWILGWWSLVITSLFSYIFR
jgi:hypothetical protein